jgi:hypothetical protein
MLRSRYSNQALRAATAITGCVSAFVLVELTIRHEAML